MKTEIYSELTVISKTDVFILFHGMFGSSNASDIKATKKVLIKKGYSVLCFDYPGHGKSTGNINDVTLEDIFDAENEILKKIKGFKNIFLLGFSFGANPIFYLAAKNKKIKGIILFNPATNILQLIFRKKTQNDLDNYTGNHRKVSLFTKIKFFIECLRHSTYNYSKKVKCPVYVYHIKQDQSVPVEQSLRLKNNIMSKNKFVFPDGYDHSLDIELKDGSFVDSILPNALNWIEKNSRN